MSEQEVVVDVDLTLEVLCDSPLGCKDPAIVRLVAGHEVGAWCETWALCVKHAGQVQKDLGEAIAKKEGMGCFRHGRRAVWWWRQV